MGDDLKFIDFHQLQIENKKYVKEIDEKNSKLMFLKQSTGKISSSLIEERQKLNQETQDRSRLEAEIAEKTKNITKITKQKEEIVALNKKFE